MKCSTYSQPHHHISLLTVRTFADIQLIDSDVYKEFDTNGHHFNTSETLWILGTNGREIGFCSDDNAEHCAR